VNRKKAAWAGFLRCDFSGVIVLTVFFLYSRKCSNRKCGVRTTAEIAVKSDCRGVTMAKLWQKDYEVNTLIETFTAGRDYIVDRELVPSDCVASMAHARMLVSIGVLTEDEYAHIHRGLLEIIESNQQGEFTIDIQDEDCHTAIENYLVSTLAETGKRIHTGRSRNDQVLVALRLYTREVLFRIQKNLLQLSASLQQLARTHEFTPMPGRTHMQIAMPSSVGLWAAGFAEELLDCYRLLDTAASLNDQSPLGAAASYGVPLPLDRELVASLLGFDRVQRNVLYVNNARGKIASVVVDAVEQVMLTLSKLAQDVILFSMPEFGYFSLPDSLCTGSSIMPQKKNPDVLELIRAKAGSVSGLGSQIKNVIRSLPTGYNRDFQETKEPLFIALRTGLDCMRVMTLTVESLTVHPEKMKQGFVPEIYATDRALELVQEGMSFREAYRTVASSMDELKQRDPVESLKKRTATGSPGNLGLDALEQQIGEIGRKLEARQEQVSAAVHKLAGREVSLYNEQMVR
jgi:argininosuccinate lyase